MQINQDRITLDIANRPLERIQCCPLCSSRNLEIRQTIASSAIIDVYGNELSKILSRELAAVPFIEYTLCQNCDLRFFNPQICGSAALYDALKATETYYQIEKPEFAFARKLISDRDEVLEVGCGDGAFGCSISPRSYLGLELTASSVVAARRAGLDVLEEDVRDYARHSGRQFDVVCGFQILEHVADPRVFLDSCVSLLKPGGRLILSVPSASSFAGHLPNHALDLPPHHVTRWTDRCLHGLSSLLPATVETIWHEPLRRLHFRMFMYSWIWRVCVMVTGRNDVVMESHSRLSRAAQWTSWKLSGVVAALAGFLYADGISVTVVLRKSS